MKEHIQSLSETGEFQYGQFLSDFVSEQMNTMNMFTPSDSPQCETEYNEVMSMISKFQTVFVLGKGISENSATQTIKFVAKIIRLHEDFPSHLKNY